MAAQLKKHSDDQLRGIAVYQQLRNCTSCGEKSFRVIETRNLKNVRRRRYQCDVCGHRDTYYELSQESYEEFVQLQKHFATLSKVFISGTAQQVQEISHQQDFGYQCLSCGFYTKSSGTCSLDIPECGTPEANDCSSYLKDK